MTGGQAVPAANGPIAQKQPVTLMQVSSYFSRCIKTCNLHLFLHFLSFSYLIRN